MFVDSERELKPHRRPMVVLVNYFNTRRSDEVVVPVDAPSEIGNCQGVMVERRK